MVIRSVVVSVCLLATLGFLERAAKAEPTPIREPLQQCPLVLADYRGQTLRPLDKRVLAELGVDEYLNRVYQSASGAPIALYIGYYGSQRQGDTVHSPKNCLPGSGWEPLTSQHLDIPLAGGAAPIEVNRYVIAKGLDRQLVLYWYQSHGRVIASEYWAKIFLTLDAIRLNRTDGALVRVITPISGSEAAAEREAMQFVQTLFPLLGQYLPG